MNLLGAGVAQHLDELHHGGAADDGVVDDDQALGDAHLGGGDAATVVLVHGVGHLLGETLKRLVAGLARLADRGENGIGGNDNGKHGIPYSV